MWSNRREHMNSEKNWIVSGYFQAYLYSFGNIQEISKISWKFIGIFWKFPKKIQDSYMHGHFHGNFQKKPNCAYCKCPIFSIICLRQPNFLRTAYLLFNMNIAIAYCYCLFLLLSVIAIASCLGFRYCLLLLPTVKHEYCYCLLPIAIA